MKSSRQAGAGDASPAHVLALAADLGEIERDARTALAAVEAVIVQAEASRRAVETLLTEVAALAAELAAGGGPSIAINNSTVSQGVRVLAVQLAAGGASKEEVAERLRDQFGIDDTAELLEAIFRRRSSA